MKEIFDACHDATQAHVLAVSTHALQKVHEAQSECGVVQCIVLQPAFVHPSSAVEWKILTAKSGRHWRRRAFSADRLCHRRLGAMSCLMMLLLQVLLFRVRTDLTAVENSGRTSIGSLFTKDAVDIRLRSMYAHDVPEGLRRALCEVRIFTTSYCVRSRGHCRADMKQDFTLFTAVYLSEHMSTLPLEICYREQRLCDRLEDCEAGCYRPARCRKLH